MMQIINKQHMYVSIIYKHMKQTWYVETVRNYMYVKEVT